MAEYGEWNRKGATLSDITAKKEYGVEQDFIVKGTKKTTVSARASDIEKVFKIRMGHEGLCNTEISDSLTFVRLPNGLVLSKKMAKEMGVLQSRS